MPYHLVGNCVHKKGSDTPIPGGCHKTHEEAIAHLRALMANVSDADISFAEFLAKVPSDISSGIYMKEKIK
jgi:hypothetical protein